MDIEGYHGIPKEPSHGPLHTHMSPGQGSVVVVEVHKTGEEHCSPGA